jgi:hypothetical protein
MKIAFSLDSSKVRRGSISGECDGAKHSSKLEEGRISGEHGSKEEAQL